MGDFSNHVNDACENLRIHAVPLEEAMLVEPDEFGKAYAAKQIFEANWGPESKEGPAGQPDFVFVAGDDREDEQVFRWANNELGNGMEGGVKDVTTVSVGKKNSEAMVTLTAGTNGKSPSLRAYIKYNLLTCAFLGLVSFLQKLSGTRR
jgi:trehalose 6-phosphate synthase/phosphatase